ncbi:MAG: hypothetical protein SWO11_03930 [Thermodesulfobacteriota bacterium]|nr:hypothetical protein [Thermodesulfobacteriota bacterium]
MPKVNIDKGLYKKAKTHAAKVGYSSVEEFISHIIEKEIKKLEESDSQQELEKRLQGLGYIS